VARPDALTRRDGQVERATLRRAGGVTLGVRAQPEVDPVQTAERTWAACLEPSSTDDEAAAGPGGRDAAERAERRQLRERAAQVGREEDHRLDRIGEPVERVLIDGAREARAVVAADGHVGESEARHR
jgi:hypothetical protein